MSQLVNDKRIKTKVVLLSNKIEQIIETWNHLNEYPSNYAEWRKTKKGQSQKTIRSYLHSSLKWQSSRKGEQIRGVYCLSHQESPERREVGMVIKE